MRALASAQQTQTTTRRGDGPKPVAAPNLVAGKDGATLLGLAFLALATGILPEKFWPRLSRLCMPLVRRTAFPAFARLRPRVTAIAGDRLAASADDILTGNFLTQVVREMQVLKCRHPFGWSPDIRLQGVDHIEAALAAGRGAVLWDSHFAYSTLVTKMGLWRAGYRVSHLSHPRHGYSKTRFGMRFLNPIRTGVETKFLAERVVMGLDSPRAALAALDARLGENGLVSVTVRAESRRPVEAPFLADKVLLAPGAANLAFPRQAPVLPVFTWRDADGVYRLRIAPPISPRDTETREDFARRVVRDYARLLEGYVAADPGQWLGWLDL